MHLPQHVHHTQRLCFAGDALSLSQVQREQVHIAEPVCNRVLALVHRRVARNLPAGNPGVGAEPVFRLLPVRLIHVLEKIHALCCPVALWDIRKPGEHLIVAAAAGQQELFALAVFKVVNFCVAGVLLFEHRCHIDLVVPEPLAVRFLKVWSDQAAKAHLIRPHARAGNRVGSAAKLVQLCRTPREIHIINDHLRQCKILRLIHNCLLSVNSLDERHYTI